LISKDSYLPSLAPAVAVCGEMGKTEDTNLLGGTAIKPKGWDRKGMEAFKYLLYNPETGEILTRTPLSWAKIIAFYIIYYSCLAGFWAACLCIFFLTIPAKDLGPKFQLDYSRIGEMPGVGLRPGPTDKRIDSQMFFLKRADTNKEHSEGGEGDLNIDYAERMKKNIELKNPKLLITMKRVTMCPNIITRGQQTPHIMDAREDTPLPISAMIRWRKSARKTLLPTQRRSPKQFARRLLIQSSLKNVRKSSVLFATSHMNSTSEASILPAMIRRK